MSDSWEQVASFDLSSLVAQYDGAPDILSEVLEIFLEEAPERLASIREGLEQNDPAKVQKAAHSLANTTGVLNAERALRLARATEESAREESADEMSRRGRLLLREVEEILRQIRTYQDSPNA
jgi:HPt (histidine-containing phosphotransfer) domain-containing protein